MNRARLNFWVDMATGFTLVLSAASGLVFLLPLPVAAGAPPQILGIGYQTWSQLHTWSSLAMIGGALLHLALHWQWVRVMTKKTLRPAAAGQTAAQANAARWSRRRVLQLGGLALASGAVAIGYRALFGPRDTPVLAADDASPSAKPGVGSAAGQTPAPTRPQTEATATPGNTPAKPRLETGPETGGSATAAQTPPPASAQIGGNAAPTRIPAPARPQTGTSGAPTQTPAPAKPQTGTGSSSSSGKATAPATCLACPKGISYDPYPGRCRLYVDRDGDRYCDLSIPAACSNATPPASRRSRPSAPDQTF